MRFTEEEAGVQKQAIPFVPARYTRNFDIISEPAQASKMLGVCVIIGSETKKAVKTINFQKTK